MKRNWFFLAILVLGVLMGGLVLAAEDDALSILRRVEEKQAAGASVSQMGMFIYPDAGADDFRSFEAISYTKGDEDEYISFIEPRSIKGLTILTKGDDQWIFFPSTGRVRKIASKSKDQSIQGVGGDFSYEDLSAGKWEEKYDFKIISTTDKEWVLAGTPKKESSYAKVNLVIDKEKLMIIKVAYYKEKEGHFKDLIMEEIKVLDGREIATRMTMINYTKNSKTVIVINDAKYNVEIDEKYFNPTRFYR